MQYIAQVEPLINTYLAAMDKDNSAESIAKENEVVNQALIEMAGENTNMLEGLRAAAALVLHDKMVAQDAEREAASEATEAVTEGVSEPVEEVSDAE